MELPSLVAVAEVAYPLVEGPEPYPAAEVVVNLQALAESFLQAEVEGPEQLPVEVVALPAPEEALKQQLHLSNTAALSPDLKHLLIPRNLLAKLLSRHCRSPISFC